jgi:hypothetical protein
MMREGGQEVFKELNNGSFIVRAPKNTGEAITS